MTRFTQISRKYLHHQKRRTVLTIIGVVLSMALLTGTGTIFESVKRQLIDNVIREKGKFHLSFQGITPEQGGIIAHHVAVNQSGITKIRGFARLKPIAPEIPTIEGQGPEYHLLRLTGFDIPAYDMFQTESRLVKGRLPREPGEIAIAERAAALFGGKLHIGSAISLTVGQRKSVSDDSIITDFIFPLSDKEEYFMVTGEEQYIVTGFLQEKIHISNNYSSDAVVYRDYTEKHGDMTFTMNVLLGDEKKVQKTAEAIADAAGIDKNSITYNTTLLDMEGRGLDPRINKNMLRMKILILSIIVIATIAVIYNTFNISLLERIAQFGILRCVGASPRQIRQVLVREAGIISLIGIPPGIVLGLAAMYIVISFADFLSANILFEGLKVVISPGVIVSSVLIGFFTIIFSAFIPARKAGKIPAMEAVRSTGMYHKGKIGGPRSSSASKGRTSFPVVMAFRNLRRNRKRFTVTLFSMVVSVALFISMGGLLNLTKETNIIHDPDMPEIKLHGDSGIGKQIYDEISVLGCVDTVYLRLEYPTVMKIDSDKLSKQYIRYVEQLSEYEKHGTAYTIPDCRVLSYGDTAFGRFKKQSKNPIDPAELIESDSAILVQKAKFTNTKGVISYAPNGTFAVGDSVIVLDEPDISINIAAVMEEPFYDDFNPSEGGFDIIVSEELFTRISGSNEYSNLYIKLKSGTDKKEILDYLEHLTGVNTGYSYIDAQALADGFTRDFFVISLFFYGFIAVIALISCLNIFNTISTNLIIRTREFGIIQAVGMDNRGVRKMVLTESLLYSLYSLIIGAVLGTGLWYVLVRTVGGVRETVFSIPLREIGIAAAGLILISAVAGFFPVKRIISNPVVENIRTVE